MKKNIELTLEQARELYKKRDVLTNSILLNSFSKEELEGLAYETISNELFYSNPTYWIDTFGNITHNLDGLRVRYNNYNNCVSQAQAEQILEMNKLRNVAYYLNGKEFIKEGYELHYNPLLNVLRATILLGTLCGNPKFKTEELALQAVEILGEESVLTAVGYYLK